MRISSSQSKWNWKHAIHSDKIISHSVFAFDYIFPILRLASHATNEPGDSPLDILPGKTKLRCLDKSSSQLILLIIVKHGRAYFSSSFLFLFLSIIFLFHLSSFLQVDSLFRFHVLGITAVILKVTEYNLQILRLSNLRCPLFICVTFANKIIRRRVWNLLLRLF